MIKPFLKPARKVTDTPSMIPSAPTSRERRHETPSTPVTRSSTSTGRVAGSIALALTAISATFVAMAGDQFVEGAPAVVELQVAGEGGVPADASAALLNIAAAQATATGFVVAWPCGSAEPTAASLNYVPGKPTSNSTIVKLGDDGKVCLRSSTPTDLIVDVNAAFPAQTDLTSFTPQRVLDTRSSQPSAAGGTTELSITSQAGVPADSTAAVLNIAAAQAGDVGHVIAWPCGEERPTAASLNYVAGEPVSNSTVVGIGAGGNVCLWTSSSVDLIVDINAAFVGNHTVDAFTPTRLIDTRGQLQNAAGSTLRVDVEGPATAAVLNIAAARADDRGYVVAWPCGDARPTAVSLNYEQNQPVSNSTVVGIDAGGDVCLYSSTDVDIIVDINGTFPLGSDIEAFTPARLLDTRGTASSPNAPSAPSTPNPPATPNTPIPSGASFAETFDGNSGLDSFNAGVYHRDTDVVRRTQWSGDHDLGCGSPDSQRTVQRDTGEWRYTCKDHMMTSIGDTSGYSTGWFSPKATFTGQNKVSWDVNVTDLGNRQWWEVMIAPADFRSGVGSCPQCAVADWLSPDPSGLPAYPNGSVVVGNGPFGRDIQVHTDGAERDVASSSICTLDPEGCGSKPIRRTFSITDNENGTVTVDYGGFATYTVPGSFPDQFNVIFKDHNYTPEKDNNPVGFTWHWDNIFVSR